MNVTIKDTTILSYNMSSTNFYISIFGEIPSERSIAVRGKSSGALMNLFKKYGILPYIERITSAGSVDMFLLNLGEHILINYDVEYHMVYIKYHHDSIIVDEIQEAINAMETVILEEKLQKISILCRSTGGFFIRETILGTAGQTMSHYPASFLPVHERIVDKLTDKHGGILLLHGEPGTGKTTYIKYLTSLIERRFIVVPENLVPHLSGPDFITFLLDQPDAILVIEDAENAVASREKAGPVSRSSVTELLNLSDGLIGQSIKCSVIATFNTDRKNIDEALLRKGRLIAEHKFEKLSVAEADVLLKSLKKSYRATAPMTLADIYNVEDVVDRPAPQRELIGFQRHPVPSN